MAQDEYTGGNKIYAFIFNKLLKATRDLYASASDGGLKFISTNNTYETSITVPSECNTVILNVDVGANNTAKADLILTRTGRTVGTVETLEGSTTYWATATWVGNTITMTGANDGYSAQAWFYI